MTREEAISTLKSLKDYYNDKDECGHVEFDDEDNEAFDMAIDVLEQEPCEDCLDKIKAEIEDTLYVDSLIFGELIDFRNGKISADDVIEEFNRVTRHEVFRIIDKYKESEEG